ncbi:head-tail adaptor protein [Mesorhizobium muleiense]|uniref:phage head completion protein n=1 Tax=Mesorhizobium muleiense TaxID=1004279 RepID=UPI001F2658CE|nr:head-tail adaptor protein [Mesorhizobium muleiense]MCF6111997.1 head-tail adaptor protein [Mesorhizobium muleiense]
MASKHSAGSLRHRVAFDARSAADDGYGNTVSGDFEERFQTRAEFRSRGGSEAVIAARLEGRNILGVYVRSSSMTRQITADWRMRDARLGTVYAIKAADSVTDPAWVYLTVESGVAA